MKCFPRIVACAFIAASPCAFAAVFKCVDATGKASFQQRPCPQGSMVSKLNVATANWVLINREDTNYYTRNKSVDIGNLKEVGRYLRAPLRETTVMKGERTGDSSALNWFVYYDCADKTISQPIVVDQAPEYERQLREDATDPKQWKLRDPNNIGLQRACASPVPAALPLAP